MYTLHCYFHFLLHVKVKVKLKLNVNVNGNGNGSGKPILPRPSFFLAILLPSLYPFFHIFLLPSVRKCHLFLPHIFPASIFHHGSGPTKRDTTKRGEPPGCAFLTRKAAVINCTISRPDVHSPPLHSLILSSTGVFPPRTRESQMRVQINHMAGSGGSMRKIASGAPAG